MSNPPIPPNVAEIAAPMLLGALWNWTLDSSSGEDVYSYNFPGDRTLVKLLVYSVFLVETLQTALTGADLYYWFVSGFGNMGHLTAPYESPFDVPIIGAIEIVMASMLAYLSRESSHRSLTLVPIFHFLTSQFSIVAAAAGLYGGIYTHVRKKFASGRMLKVLALTWVSGNASADILIAGSLLFYLGRRRREGCGQFSEHALSKVVRLIIETNVLTTTVGIVTLLTVAIFPVGDSTTFHTFDDSSQYSNIGQALVHLPNSRPRKTLAGAGADIPTRSSSL
ncbi:hypothetical protein EDB84DRAFT_1561133 [Lactarius hengduanensis]|nr:hypothetical protein EDB84DRAFT_1561133 [Lactarius hengduanensis]